MLTSRTCLPCSAKWIAVAQDSEVLPTPPLPVKNELRCVAKKLHDVLLQQQPVRGAQLPGAGGTEAGASGATPASARARRAADSARQRNLVIDENEGQRVLPGTVQEALDSSVVDKGHRLLAQVEPLDPGPCCLAHSRSAAKVTNCWSTSTPHTPVLQHMAGSKTLISGLRMAISSW